VRIKELITELLTASIAKNATYKRKNTYSKIINVADCKTCKKRSLAVEYLILIIYTYPTAKTRTLCKSTDEPAGRPADNPPSSDRLGDLHRTGPELTFQLYWQAGPSIWQRFGSDPDPDPKWRSGTVAITRNDLSIWAKISFVQARWLRQCGHGLSAMAETPWLQNSLHLTSIPQVALHIALQSQFHHFFSLSRSPISKKHSGVVANSDHTSEWVYWVCSCIRIALQWVTLRKSLLAFLLPARKAQFSLYWL